MSGRATWTEGALFLKRHPSPALARIALERSRAARRAGIATPRARPGPAPDVVAFDKLEAAVPADLGAALATLATLGRMPRSGLDRFDPCLRILPRYRLAPDDVRRWIADLCGQTGPATGVVHGDFHPGQVLRDTEGGTWLVDLDDMALGPPEADLGNLAAWMATRHEARLAEASQAAIRAVSREWTRLGRPIDADVLDHFHRIALIRRALKLAERGDTWALEQIRLIA